MRSPGFLLLLLTVLFVQGAGAAEPASARTDFTMGGFLKFHFLHGDIGADRKSIGNQQIYIPHIRLPEQAGEVESRTLFNARDSRFWFRAQNPGGFGGTEFLFEFDLYESARRYDPRVRHAYGMFGRLLIGQTFTTFTNTSALADIETGTAPGSIVTRHAMLRWTQELTEELELVLSLEEAFSRVTHAGESGFVAPGNAPMPDTVLRLQNFQSWGNVSLAAMLRKIPGTQVDAGSVRQKQWGGALSLAGRIESRELDNLRFMFSYGDALARYSTLGTYADGNIDEDGQLKLNTVHSGLLAWQHYWHARWRSTFALSYSQSNLPEHAHADLTKAARTAHLNLVWIPRAQSSFGLEYAYGKRKVQDGREADLDRLQFTARFNF